jgi:hypothetical protein
MTLGPQVRTDHMSGSFPASRHLAARCQVSRTPDPGRCTITSARHVGRFLGWGPARAPGGEAGARAGGVVSCIRP